MRGSTSRLAFLGLMLTGSAYGQIMPSTQPEQFYSNGEKMNAWTPDPANHRRTTFWFARYARGDWAYRQQLAIIYDSRPDKVYYYDPYTREFRGRFDMVGRAYSLLPEGVRSGDLEEIREDDFPLPGEMPSIDEMLRRPTDTEAGSMVRMAPPPPTAEFPPRLGVLMQDVIYVENGIQVAAVQITAVEPGSPAAFAGLEIGDIIVRIDGIRVTNCKDAQILISRSGGLITLRVKDVHTGDYIDTSKIELNMLGGSLPPLAPAPDVPF